MGQWVYFQELVIPHNITGLYLCLKVKVKVKFALKQATKAQKGSRVTTIHFL